jgi:hypothetical protein
MTTPANQHFPTQELVSGRILPVKCDMEMSLLCNILRYLACSELPTMSAFQPHYVPRRLAEFTALAGTLVVGPVRNVFPDVEQKGLAEADRALPVVHIWPIDTSADAATDAVALGLDRTLNDASYSVWVPLLVLTLLAMALRRI